MPSTQDVASPRAQRPPLLVPLLGLGAATLLIALTDLDLKTADRFFSGADGFPWRSSTLGRALNQTCRLLGAGWFVVSLAILVGSRWSARMRRQRLMAAFVLAALLIGPGLVVNVLGKQQMGRPRPWEIERYGGSWPFVPVFVPANTDGKSFPSGDAAMGFFFSVPAFLLWRDRRRAAWAVLALGVFGWLVMASSRVAGGAHWVSDVLWSAGFVYLSAHLTLWLFARAARYGPWSSWFETS